MEHDRQGKSTTFGFSLKQKSIEKSPVNVVRNKLAYPPKVPSRVKRAYEGRDPGEETDRYMTCYDRLVLKKIGILLTRMEMRKNRGKTNGSKAKSAMKRIGVIKGSLDKAILRDILLCDRLSADLLEYEEETQRAEAIDIVKETEEEESEESDQ